MLQDKPYDTSFTACWRCVHNLPGSKLCLLCLLHTQLQRIPYLSRNVACLCVQLSEYLAWTAKHGP